MKRRILLAAALILAVAVPVIPTTAQTHTIRYITSPARGNGSGDSWANGAIFQSLPTLLAASNPGDEIRIEGGDTHTSNGMTLTSTRLGTATAASRVWIHGVNEATGLPMDATVAGTIRPEPWVTGGAQGNRLLKLEGGIRFLHISDLVFTRHAEAIQFRHPDNAGFLFEDLTFDNVSVAFSQATLEPSLTDSTFRRIVGRGHTGNFVGLNGDSNNIVLEDFDTDAEYQDDGQPGKGSNGVFLAGTAHDITMTRMNMRNGGREEGANYWNGDGVVTDNFNDNILIEDSIFSGWLDGGVDLKSSNTILRRVTSSDNKRNYRFHSADDFVVEDSQSLFPNKRGGSGTQDHYQLEHNSTQPFPSTTVHVYDTSGCGVFYFVDDDDPASFVSNHTGGPTLLVFHGGTIRKDAASPMTNVGFADRTVLDGTVVENI